MDRRQYLSGVNHIHPHILDVAAAVQQRSSAAAQQSLVIQCSYTQTHLAIWSTQQMATTFQPGFYTIIK